MYDSILHDTDIKSNLHIIGDVICTLGVVPYFGHVLSQIHVLIIYIFLRYIKFQMQFRRYYFFRVDF